MIRDWCLHFSSDPPTRLTIYRIRDKFEETGSVTDAPRSGRPTMCTKENIDIVSEANARSSQKSLRRGSAEMGIKRTSLPKILTELNMKPNIPRLIHRLLEDDPDRRSQFCEHFVSLCEDNTTFLNQIVWTDEAAFKLSEHVNRHNCVYWSDKNPHFTIATELNQPGIIGWAGIVGRVFFEGTVSGEKYLEKLKTAVVPALKERFLKILTVCTSNKMEPHLILQQLSKISWMRRFPINGLAGEALSNSLHAHQT